MTAALDSVGPVPGRDEIRQAIDRITASDVFSRSPQLGAFLRFVVEAVLHGKGDRIKAYTIGVEVLRRDTSFDPQLDPIVRVEATRLRRAIERYYAGPGADDPVVIDLPRGTYVPTFRLRDARIAGATADVTWRARPVLWVAAVALLVAIGMGWMLRKPIASRDGSDAVATLEVRNPSKHSLPYGNGMPTVYVEQFRVVGTPSDGALAVGLLFEKINGAFARFDTINVVYAPRETVGSPGETLAPRTDYRLSGAVEYREGETSVQFWLLDVAEGSVVWSRSFERLRADAKGVAEAQVVGALTEALLQSYGVIRSRDRAKHLVSDAGDPRYRCILEAADSLRTLSHTEHDRARTCLEQLTAVNPSFAVGYAFLALIYGREYQLGLGARSGDTPPLDRALRAVRRSIELNPASARAYVVLMVVLFHRGEVTEALAAGEKAMALNQYDMLAPAELGGRLILLGETGRGLNMMRRAAEFSAIRPAWQHYYIFLGAYLGGDLKEAAYQAGQITADNYASTHLVRALLAVSAGDGERARQAAERLSALQPGWRQAPRRELAKLSPSPQVQERLARDLAKAGIAGL
jgi:tetratricopeptide (TPR) repeat protein